MNQQNKQIKINPLLIISILLLVLFVFIISNRIIFIFSNVEKVLVEQKAKNQTQKSFNLELFKDLQTRMSIK